MYLHWLWEEIEQLVPPQKHPMNCSLTLLLMETSTPTSVKALSAI